MARSLLAVLAVAILAPAVASAGDAPPGYRRHAVSNAGVSIAVPIGWQVLAQRDAVFPGARQNLTRLDASFGPTLTSLGMPDSPLKIFAFDQRFRRGHPTTLLVVQATYRRPAAYERWAPGMVRALRAAPGKVGAVAHTGVALPMGRALRATYRTRTRETVVVYLVPGPAGIFALLLRTPTARAATDAPALARMARSLDLQAPLGGPYLHQPPPGS